MMNAYVCPSFHQYGQHGSFSARSSTVPQGTNLSPSEMRGVRRAQRHDANLATLHALPLPGDVTAGRLRVIDPFQIRRGAPPPPRACSQPSCCRKSSALGAFCR